VVFESSQGAGSRETIIASERLNAFVRGISISCISSIEDMMCFSNRSVMVHFKSRITDIALPYARNFKDYDGAPFHPMAISKSI